MFYHIHYTFKCGHNQFYFNYTPYYYIGIIFINAIFISLTYYVNRYLLLDCNEHIIHIIA